MRDHDRELTLRAADEVEAAAAARPPASMLVGFDGFVDTLLHVVDRRHGFAREQYAPIGTIESFAARAAGAAGRSTNLELVELEDRPGGNAPLLARALGTLGAAVTLAGAVGEAGGGPLPIYEPWLSVCERVVPLCTPGRTLAMEFEDGKLMFNIAQPVQDVTWERLTTAFGPQGLELAIASADWLCLNNWSLLGGMGEILERIAEVLAHRSPTRRIYIDLSDPAKRTDEDVRALLDVLERLDKAAPLTLGLNVPEAERLVAVRGRATRAAASAVDLSAIAAEAIDVSLVVVHGHREAGAAGRNGGRATIATPFTSRPSISTGAGDHFNAGCVLALSLGLAPEVAIAAGAAAAGHYVRTTRPPALDQLLEMLRRYPMDE